MSIPKLHPLSNEAPSEPPMHPNLPNTAEWAPYDNWRMMLGPTGVFRYWNSRYSVSVTEDKHQMLVKGRCWRALIIRADQSAHRDYRDFMRIKDDLFGPNYEAIELLPSRSREVDPSNAFFMFVFDVPLRIGETTRNVLHPAEAIAPQRKFDKAFKCPEKWISK